jgi:hypothetical protein
MAWRGILAPSGPRKHPGSTQFHCALIVDDADSCYDGDVCWLRHYSESLIGWRSHEPILSFTSSSLPACLTSEATAPSERVHYLPAGYTSL